MSDTTARTGTIAANRVGGIVLVSFAATLLLSAFLLFSVQPLFTKLVLPRLGGTSAVWSIALVFFQGMLLAGYAYAHALVRFTGRLGLPLHAAIMALGLFWLPVAAAAGFETPPTAGLPLWVLTLFALSIGIPFFAVSANAPLLQAWFSRSGHRHARDPYFLYGASNVGSFLALLSYPVLIEPLLTLQTQSRFWTAGYATLAAAVVGCGAFAWHRGRVAEGEPSAETPRAGTVTWPMRLRWVGFAFLPSALLVAVTAHLSTNIAAAPFLWVTPLAVFLLSFIVTFTRQPLIPIRGMQMLLPVVLPAAMATVSYPGLLGGLVGISINVFTLFVVAVVWHGELFARRPDAPRLTDFYLSMSFGGVLGGVFTALVAPAIFDSIAEFPLLLGLSILAIPEMRALLLRPRARPFVAVGLVGLFGLIYLLTPPVEYRSRNFFGVISTELTDDGRFRLMMHGNTIHGAERVSEVGLPPSVRPEPLTYFAAGGPFSEAFAIARNAKQGGSLSVGIVGLGAGSLACYSQAGDDWRLYEIDPAVIGLAKDTRYFTFLASCAPQAPILEGDGRLLIQKEPDARFDVLVFDAFSSDSIPVHLITQEALRLYARKIKPDGLMLLNISNRFMEFGSVVAATSAAEGLHGVRKSHFRPDREFLESLKTSSEVVALAKDPRLLEPFVRDGWERLAPDGSVAAWTDDYSNIVGAVLRMQGLLPTPVFSR